MPSDPTDEDTIATDLADATIRLVDESHPHASPKFRRRIARLYLRQLTGSEKPPGRISDASVASYIGISKQRASETKQTALGKLYLALRERHPELFQ
jgi:hypothetical protein